MGRGGGRIEDEGKEKGCREGHDEKEGTECRARLYLRPYMYLDGKHQALHKRIVSATRPQARQHVALFDSNHVRVAVVRQQRTVEW